MGNYGLAGALKKPETDFMTAIIPVRINRFFLKPFISLRPPAFNPHFLFQEAMIRAAKSFDIS